MKYFLLYIVYLILNNTCFSQIGWYLKVNGTVWNGSDGIPNNAKLIFGLKEGTNLTPCYNLTTTKLSMGSSVLANPTGLKNPWNIDLATVLNGKTGNVTIEIYGKGCTSTAEQHWIVSFVANASTSTTTSSSAPAGTTVETSISKTSPRKQHVVAKVKFTNTNGTVNKVAFVTGYPETGNYQTVSNLKLNGGVLKTATNGTKYLEYTYTNVAKGSTVYATYEYDITTWTIEVNTSKAGTKTYVSNTDYTRYTKSVSTYTDYTTTKVKTIGNDLWLKSGNNYLTYVNKVAEWMSNNTEWVFTGGIIKSNDFFNTTTAGKYKGDCGSLSNAMVTLLRYKGIPARLLVGYGAEKMTSTDAKFHAWLEFYIQDFGWVPVDPSYRNNGKIEVGKIPHKGIIVSKDAFFTVDMLANSFANMFIQSYLWAVDGNIPANSYTLGFTAVSSNFTE